jgi:hypothetical protein
MSPSFAAGRDFLHRWRWVGFWRDAPAVLDQLRRGQDAAGARHSLTKHEAVGRHPCASVEEREVVGTHVDYVSELSDRGVFVEIRLNVPVTRWSLHPGRAWPWPAASRRPEATMRPPSFAKASAVARPIPVSAPVINTTGSFMSVLLELDLMVKLNKLIATAAPIAM